MAFPWKSSQAQEQFARRDTLILTSRNLQVFPDSVFQHANLKYLNLGVSWMSIAPLTGMASAPDPNMIRFIPEKIGSLKELERLDMTFNDLQDLPESIAQLQKLHFLSIAYNRKFRLKENLIILKQLTGLRVLDITGIENAMEYAPILIEELPQLDKIIFRQPAKE